MGKCFLGLWFGIAMGLAYLSEELARGGASLGRSVSGMLEWVYIGGFLTVCALAGYAVYLLCERLTGRRTP